MTYGESNNHVTDDVTWSWKVGVVTSIFLGPSISKTAGDATVGLFSNNANYYRQSAVRHIRSPGRLS